MYITMRDKNPTSLVTIVLLCPFFGPAQYVINHMTPESREFYDPLARTMIVALACTSVLSTATAMMRLIGNRTLVTKSSCFVVTFSCIAFTNAVMPSSFQFFDPDHSWKDVAGVAMSGMSTFSHMVLIWVMVGVRRNRNVLSNSSCIVMAVWWVALLVLSHYGIRLDDFFDDITITPMATMATM
ncbi:hypothetical protein C8J56DRAFT_558362 [Mycena floridula]|nr:hypothetical protein C8J56DRAFT_558362 [Mycena floridula]